MIYVYDFGDNWEHEVVLEKIVKYKIILCNKSIEL
jgi:hypothetical protein